MAFTGPGIACDWLDVEGPLHDVWPPPVAQAPLRRPAARRVQARATTRASARRRGRRRARPEIVLGKNRPDPVAGHLDRPQRATRSTDADRLLAAFLPRAFRRPVADEVRQALRRARRASG